MLSDDGLKILGDRTSENVMIPKAGVLHHIHRRRGNDDDGVAVI